MTDRAFIEVEEIDRVFSETESMLNDAAPGPARSTALAALAGIRMELGVLSTTQLAWIERAREQEAMRQHKRPRGHLRIPRREDGELDD